MKRLELCFALASLLSTASRSEALTHAWGNCPTFPAPASKQAGGPFAFSFLGASPVHSPPTHHVDVPSGRLERIRIILERSRCYGDCPNYRVELRGSGEVVFEGGDFVAFSGTHKTRISRSSLQCLLQDFRTADFWSLDPEYMADVADLPTYRVSLTVGGKTKTLTDYAGRLVGMPGTVTALEQTVDEAAGTEIWIRGNDKTIGALEAEHFDFHSRAAADLLARAAVGAPDIVVFGLLERGAPLNGLTEEPDSDAPISAIEAAAMNGRLNVVRRLIKAGAFSKGGKKLVSATLRASVASRRAEMVREILAYHPDVNSTDRDGETALSRIFLGPHPHAGEENRPDENAAIIELLGRAGANPNFSKSLDLLGWASSREEKDALIAIGARASGSHYAKSDAGGRGNPK